MSRRGYHHPWSAQVFFTSPHHSHTVELLAASLADHKNSLSSFALPFIHAHSDRGKRNKKTPIKNLAGFDGECSYEKPQNDELLMSINVLAMWTVSN